MSAAWDPETRYQRGDQVLLEGLPYQARWASRGEAPSSQFPVSSDSAW